MVSTPVPGFITKKDAAENYQRSHRQITRDLADAMKVQDPKVLDNCRLRTEDGETREGIGVTPELLDQLRIDGKNPVWYLRTSWLEKIYGRRGDPRRQKSSGPFTADAEEGSDLAARPDLVHVLRERIRGLERDKEDLRDEMKIKNEQIADRVEREKETNALIRDLHTLMADLQRRLLPPPTQGPPPRIPEAFIDSRADTPRTPPQPDEPTAKEASVSPPSNVVERGSHRKGKPSPTPTKQRRSRGPVRRKTSTKKSPATKKERPAGDAAKTTKSRSFLSRLFSR